MYLFLFYFLPILFFCAIEFAAKIEFLFIVYDQVADILKQNWHSEKNVCLLGLWH